MPTDIEYEPLIGFTGTVKVNDGDGTVFKNPLVITIPKREFGEFESTKLNQSDKDRRFNPTLRDNGLVMVEGFFSKPEHVRLMALHGVRDKTWTVTTPDPNPGGAETGMLLTIPGWLKEMGEVKLEKDKEMLFSFGIRVSGPIVYGDAPNI